MKKLLFILLLFSHLLIAQDIKINKQYLTAPDLINPAFTGSELCFQANIMGTFQWLGLANSPRTYLFNIQKGFNANPFEGNSRYGFGGTMYTDRNGPFSFTGLRASYAFHSFMNKTHTVRLSFGLSATGTWFRLNQGLLNPNSSIQPINPALNYTMNNSVLPNMGAGIVLSIKRLYMGFSALSLLPLAPSYESVSINNRSYYFITGYKSLFSQSNFRLEPLVMYNISNNGIQEIDGSLLSVFYQQLGLGLTYRHCLLNIPGSPNSFAMRITLFKGYWSYTYVYDVGFNSLQFNSMGNHEISIGYRICTKQLKRCPAY
jgi:type IX secretion system PorP/SprF family membrane protein